MRKSLSKKIRNQVSQMFGGRCAYCGQMPEKLCVDHVHPVASSYRFVGNDVNDISNLLPACFSCNNYKMSFDLEQFRSELQDQVHRARKTSLNFRLAERFGLIQTVDKSILFYFEINQGKK